LHAAVDNLADNITVGSPDYKTVFRGVELVLVLSAQAFPGLVISLAFPASAEFNLVPFEVRFVFLDLDESSLWLPSSFGFAHFGGVLGVVSF